MYSKFLKLGINLVFSFLYSFNKPYLLNESPRLTLISRHQNNIYLSFYLYDLSINPRILFDL